MTCSGDGSVTCSVMFSVRVAAAGITGSGDESVSSSGVLTFGVGVLCLAL